MRLPFSSRRHLPEQPVIAPVSLIEDRGSFTHGFCPTCGWQGPGRRARAVAARDFEAHAALGCTPLTVADVVECREVAGSADENGASAPEHIAPDPR